MSNKVIVSFASHGREEYNKYLMGLIRSCVNAGWDGDYLIRSLDGYCDEYKGVKIELGSWPTTQRYGKPFNQAESPYQFKVYAIQEARERGFRQICWCDSSIRMKKDITPLFEYAKEHGIAAFNNLGHPLKFWISDYALKMLHITEQELEGIEQIMACCILLDFDNPICVEIFERWLGHSRDGVSFQNYGSTREGFVAPRNDQACLSGLLWKYKVPLLPYGKLVYPPHDTSGEYGNDIYFVNKAND